MEKSADHTHSRIRVDRPVIVEGKYDKNTLSQVIDAHIVATGGFSVFRKNELTALLRRLAREKGVIVLTDSDGGGKQIRSYLSSVLPPECVTHLYIPQIEGKERRKDKASASGFLGVEGMEASLLRQLFLPFSCDAPSVSRMNLTKADFYAKGLSGKPDSESRRAALAQKMGLPRDLTANALLASVNLLLSQEEFDRLTDVK